MVNKQLWSGSCRLFFVPTTGGAATRIYINREWEPKEQDKELFFLWRNPSSVPCGQPQSATDERHNEKPRGKGDNRTQCSQPMKTWKSFFPHIDPRWNRQSIHRTLRWNLNCIRHRPPRYHRENWTILWYYLWCRSWTPSWVICIRTTTK